MTDIFNGFDQKIDDALAKIIGRGEMDPSDKIARGLPSRLGWPGIYRHSGYRGDIQSIQCDIMTLKHIEKYYPHLRSYVDEGYASLLQEELVSENQMRHDNSEHMESDADANSQAPSYDFKPLLDSIAHRDKAELVNYRSSTNDYKAMTWANSQHSQECGSWLKGRNHDFYPFPTANPYFMGALNLLMSAPKGENPFFCSCSAKINVRSDPWHCLDCPSTHAVRTRCHTRILDALQLALQSVGKVTGSPRLMKGNAYIYSDLQFCRGTDSKLFNIDGATVNPTAPTYLIPGGPTPTDHASTIIELQKRTKYEGSDSHPDNQNIAFVVECTGRLGRSARDFIKEAGLDDKKRNALKNEIASILAFANGECIATAFMKGSTRRTSLMDHSNTIDTLNHNHNRKRRFSINSTTNGGSKNGQLISKNIVNAPSSLTLREITGGPDPVPSPTKGDSEQFDPLPPGDKDDGIAGLPTTDNACGTPQSKSNQPTGTLTGEISTPPQCLTREAVNSTTLTDKPDMTNNQVDASEGETKGII